MEDISDISEDPATTSTMNEADELRSAIGNGDLERVKDITSEQPGLLRSVIKASARWWWRLSQSQYLTSTTTRFYRPS